MAKNDEFDGGLGGSYGETDMFGLNEFGEVDGKMTMWGAVAGAGISSGAAIAVRALAPTMTKWAELIGAATGAAVGAGMVAFEGTKAAGWTAIAASVVSGGLRQLEVMFGGHGAFGAVAIDQLRGVGLPGVEYLNGGYGGGMGIHTIEPSATFSPNQGVSGIIGVPSGGPPSLVGADMGMGMNAAAQSVTINGGPTISGLGSHWGATLFGAQ